jgi:hypothetical protein
VTIIDRFVPPANLPDLDSIPGQREQWHKAVSYWFDSLIDSPPTVHPGPAQFYNPARFDPGGLVVEQTITWNAFPKELLRLFGRERALQEADKLWPLHRFCLKLLDIPTDKQNYPLLYEFKVRPQTEYCEWRVERDRTTSSIRSVTFTSEPPEFWFALSGNHVPGDPPKYHFKGNRKALLAKYEQFVGHKVQYKDLIAPGNIYVPGSKSQFYAKKKGYNIFNKWNTEHGIVHLCCLPNFLIGEIELAAAGSILYKNRAGHLLVEPEALICCSQTGGPNRNSDPTIVASVNAAARLGAYVTLKDPIGIYMDHIDLSGWECPDKKSVADCIHIVRGSPGMIERLVVEVPKDRNITVSDITIGGEPIRFGGQIAECITVKIIAIAHIPTQPVRNAPVRCSGRGVINPRNPFSLVQLEAGMNLSRRPVEAFASQGTEEGALPRGEPSIRRLTITRQRPRKRKSNV